MNAMTYGRSLRRPDLPLCSRPTLQKLDRGALAAGAASYRLRVETIEAEIEHACERAALRGGLHRKSADRSDWDRRTWERYLAEAVRKAHYRGADLDALRTRASHLERLIRAV
jgi:hypothetical protein